MSYFEYVEGQESHTSYWGKFYVKGLEQFMVKEDHELNRRDRHHSYQCWAGEIPDGTCFTIFEQNGSKRGTDVWKFLICECAEGESALFSAEYGSGCLEGSYRIICQGLTKVKAPRLMGWWTKGEKSANFASHCARYIDKRGLKELPEMSSAS